PELVSLGFDERLDLLGRQTGAGFDVALEELPVAEERQLPLQRLSSVEKSPGRELERLARQVLAFHVELTLAVRGVRGPHAGRVVVGLVKMRLGAGPIRRAQRQHEGRWLAILRK